MNMLILKTQFSISLHNTRVNVWNSMWKHGSELCLSLFLRVDTRLVCVHLLSCPGQIVCLRGLRLSQKKQNTRYHIHLIEISKNWYLPKNKNVIVTTLTDGRSGMSRCWWHVVISHLLEISFKSCGVVGWNSGWVQFNLCDSLIQYSQATNGMN